MVPQSATPPGTRPSCRNPSHLPMTSLQRRSRLRRPAETRMGEPAHRFPRIARARACHGGDRRPARAVADENGPNGEVRGVTLARSPVELPRDALHVDQIPEAPTEPATAAAAAE